MKKITASFFIAIIFLSYFASCKKLLEPEELRPYFVGRWELIYTTLSDSSSYVHKQWLTLKDDQSFDCTSSFFWSNDSLKFSPFIGRWYVNQYFIDASKGVKGDIIYITVDTLTKSWDVSGGNKSGYMLWQVRNLGGSPYYQWSLVKE